MISKVLLLLLPAAVLSDLTVNIFRDRAPEFFGSVTDVITDDERGAFHIHDNDLKNAVDKFTHGRPDDAYVRSPTPWGDLYKKLGWSEVRRTLKVRSSRLLGVNTQPTVVTTKKFHNGSPRTATYKGDLSLLQDNTVTHKWTKSGAISFGQKINYSVDLLGNKVGGTTSFVFKNTFGEESVNTVSTKLGSKSSVSITLHPGQTAVAVLSASKGTMDVEIEYEASLEGSVATNYGGKHNGHYFWAFDINSVLGAAGLPKTVVWKETIHIGFYADERVVAYDEKGQPL